MDDELVQNLSELTADIVSAYVSNNTVRPEDLPALIGEVHSALAKAPGGAAEPAPQPQEPAVSVRSSVKPDYIICLEDGKKFKSLKRHLRNEHNMAPDEYRAKWGLKKDYPMVAPAYSEARSNLAKTMGLGRKSGGANEGQGGGGAGRNGGRTPAKRGKRSQPNA